MFHAKNVYMNVYSSVIHNSQKVVTTQMSINRRTDKQNVAYPYYGIFFSHKKKLSTDACYNKYGP